MCVLAQALAAVPVTVRALVAARAMGRAQERGLAFARLQRLQAWPQAQQAKRVLQIWPL